MTQRQPSGEPPLTGRFDVICRVIFELALLLGALTIGLTAVQGALTHHATIDRVIDASHFSSSVADPGAFRTGETYPLYRFHEGFQQPLGNAEAEKVDGSEVVFRFDPKAAIVPVGRHGKVLSVDGDQVRVDVGSSLGFRAGNDLRVFDQRTNLGAVQLVEVGRFESTAKIGAFERPIPLDQLVGKVVSEYSVATQAASFDSPAVVGIEVLAYLLLIGGYVVSWRRSQGSPLVGLFSSVANRVRSPAWLKLAWYSAIGIPVTWYITEFAMRGVGFAIWIAYANFIHKPIPDRLTYDLGFQPAHLPLFCLTLIGYQWLLWWKRESPIKPFQHWIAFRGGVFGHAASDVPEHITMFCLQAIIVYTFARTIGGFLQGNLNAAIVACWPGAPKILTPDNNPFNLEMLRSAANSIGYAFSHTPHPANRDVVFSSVDYLVYDICIIPCLIGYAYSFFGYLFGKRIRNTDFTVIGWVTNGVCYGPLLGVVFWTMFPPVFGVDPTVVPGFLRTATFAVAVSMNIVYTLSIWNLGVLFGVMTDKGVRTTGFYSVVRHPNYTIESIMFVIFYCRELSTFIQWDAVCGFLLIYWLRSEREDQFMSASNPEYLEYRKQVPYKFIPGLY
jgi:protein-S-isoprenylcysteine O-methyltransferase Ste14